MAAKKVNGLAQLFVFIGTVGFAADKPAKPLSHIQRVAHMFDRLAFGARAGEAEKIIYQGPKGIDRWIAEQMNPAQIKDSSLDANLKTLPSLTMKASEILAYYKKPNEVAKSMGIAAEEFKNSKDIKQKVRAKIGEDHLPERLVEEIVAQKIIRAVESRKQLQEVLVDFWFNHFNVNIRKGEEQWILAAYERDAIRAHVFGKFRDLLGATAHHPAMLLYLDNRLSENGEKGHKGLNENYARELLELHTLGVNGGYTQKDVTELARILTGWSIDDINRNPEFKFRERAHDHGAKEFLQQAFPEGHGEDEGERVFDLLAKHASTADFIAQKLCENFVSDHPPEALVKRVAKVFLKTGGDLSQTYLSIFNAPEFWDRAAYRSKIKKPFQFVVSSVRAMGGEVAAHSDLRKALAQMGEELYMCVPPTGYLDNAEAWVNPGALVERLNFSMRLAANRVEGVYAALPAVKVKNSVEKMVDDISAELLHERLSDQSRTVVIGEFGKETRLMADGEVRPLSLAKATGLILGSPEFQRR